MDVYEALYTTRAMRRVKTDPIPLDVQAKILDAAIRAPTGGNTQNWRFLLIDDRAKIGELTPIYQRCIASLWKNFYKERIDAVEANPEAESSIADSKMVRSAQHLADHFADIPLLLFAFAQGDPSGSSIYPAVWSAQLCRARGGGRHLADSGVGVRAGRDPQGAGGSRRRRLVHVVLRDLRLPDRRLGGRQASSR